MTSVDPNLPKGIETKLETLEEGREYQVRVTLNPELGKGPFHGKLTLHTDSPKVPTLEVEVKGDRRLSCTGPGTTGRTGTHGLTRT